MSEQQKSPSTKPYLLRALWQWCEDNGYTPYIAVWVNEHTRVPMQFVQDNQIVLSISAAATKDLQMDNEWISFHARFHGESQEVWVPVGHVQGIFAKETGEGMGFEVEAWQPPETEAAPKKKVLRLVK
ncbi:ClpXP protease specificity-enhancing factor [Conchiformibius kuhniae]|uniref:ClpXP protease specificity-enhancing factor n=1 Tax=Conchiformibius kuhniae TaxID=211502 RepID=A0ABD8B808_9NEIS|nr:ClpXP protease specificity-enhancing factor [Conchiformibius kuhniae]